MHEAHASTTGRAAISLIALEGLPEVQAGADLEALLVAPLRRLDPPLVRFDVLVVAQKIVSKAENRFVDLAAISPSARARELALVTGKDPRLLEAILAESTEVLLRLRDGREVAFDMGEETSPLLVYLARPRT